MKPGQHSPSEEEKHPNSKEVRDMVNAITGRMNDLFKTGSSLQNEDDEDNGVRIITLAGTNTGASMRSELDDKKNVDHQVLFSQGEAEPMNTYVNSNFQSVNNSIMFNSHYNTNDPGVHMDITDVFEHQGHLKPDKLAKKGKKKDKEAFESDQQAEQSN
ncbi:uncharacterized protein LOC123204772 [Mangifera indica]|uniref:uncharacterized protein LOC123204772 n=1 Tax=Mangifera indica TaxID=29780 RepID=UPI001CF9A753|nr:uncharacterized protein LOC123204772 [Mangifera indica]